MPKIISILEACRRDFFKDAAELLETYPQPMAERIMRLRDMYNQWLANPSLQDRELRDLIMSSYGVSQSCAYSDISVLHQLVPLFSQKSRDFHRARYNEMMLETYAMAKKQGDAKAMERAASSYARYNDVAREDEVALPYDEIVPQPFRPTLDVRELGVKPIPNVDSYIARLIKELSGDFADIMDVEAEEADLDEQLLFSPLKDDPASQD